MKHFSNRLINETSPYLLQHAHNPVDWYPWSDEAFLRAKSENKPVLVSIGYSACHWCHVMERESFEDPEVAAVMNEHFINIKVDREERPDVDHIYMDAVQAMTGSGGWPLNVFITPEGKPFYGGTYFPPRRAFNRASWTEVLHAIAHTYKEKPEDVEEQAKGLTEHLRASNNVGYAGDEFTLDTASLDQAFHNVMKTADQTWGGFGRAPKFPQTFTINFLLRYHSETGNKEALSQALLSIDKMINGGIYDHLGGGFARYSTDTEWLVPHFEKMLYDNALIIGSLAEAYLLTQRDRYREIIAETTAFVERELMHEEGGFFSALDADSEGEEGKYYVWQYDEIQQVLGAQDAALFSEYYNIREEGNWEGNNILHTSGSLEEFASKKGMEPGSVRAQIERCKELLMEARAKRIRPMLDDKLLLSWNALMNIAYCKAYRATQNEHYKDVAIRNMQFMLNAFANGDGTFCHTWKNGQARHLAFLDDYSFLMAAQIELAQITADYSWLHQAKELADYVVANFSDEEASLFFFTQVAQKDILIRKKEVYDSALPSGNSLMAYNLYQLSLFFDNQSWRLRAEKMIGAFGSIAVKYPTSFGVWLSLLLELTYGTKEIAILGSDFRMLLAATFPLYLPHSIIMASETEQDFPLLKNRSSKEHTLIYLCRNYTCQKPVSTIEDLKTLVKPDFL